MKTKILPDRRMLGVLGLACCVGAGTAVSVMAQAKPQAKPQTKSQAKPQTKPEVKTVASASMTQRKPLPRYLPLEDINALRALRGKDGPPPVLQPLFQGRALNGDHVNLATGSATLTQVAARVAGIDSLDGARLAQTDGTRLAQAMPQPVPPAAIPAEARVAVPKWVRYPLEFQLGGIGLGTLAVDKDQFNRIDRYGLFAIHGNPTAVVVPTGGGTIMQTPAEVADLFPSSEFGALPGWSAAVAVDLDSNHVQWLYRRETYSMGFVVDRLGFVDAIVVAGVESPMARTQLEDPVHTIKLGDDLRKVLFRYGYPDNIGTGQVAVAGAGSPMAAAAPEEGMGPDGMPGLPGLPGAPGEPGAEGEGAGGNLPGNAAFRTFEISYEQSYNISFTIRDNRVVRMYIFGNPEFFNDQRRQLLRTQY